jgi:hypothetical protein
VLVLVITAVAIADPFAQGKRSLSGVLDNANSTSLTRVTRQDLSSQTQVPAMLGYAGNYTAIDQAAGTVTTLPSIGQVVSQGQALYQVNGAPVALLYGSIPIYRALSSGLSGADVAELNADLVALGYATPSELPASTTEFTYWSRVGVERLQAALDVTRTGTLALGQAVIAPSAIRVTSLTTTLGAPAEPGQPLLSATSTMRQVSIAMDVSEESDVTAGDKVAITLPNSRTTPGVVTSVGTVATTASSGTSSGSSSDSSGGSSGTSNPTIPVLITPTDPAATGSWDQAPVDVTITTASANNVLVVPVNALVALSGGGYSVEVVASNGAHHLVSVSLGLFDDADGLVEVTGSELAAGQQIVVPGS